MIFTEVSTSSRCKTDIHVAEGDLPLKKSSLILGHEIVGIVDKTGINIFQ
ncbi:MAG: alcohol dehydrogenase catalytic domain-containing protein [Candidatus Aminicenantes bacterium]|nr:alcohol dehydrogenase catalytic domain-containing protein [Candidatus Aminicenantes bacterium]